MFPPSPRSASTQFFYVDGTLVRPARLFFYRPQTEDPITVYTDALLSVPHPQPLPTGGSGRVPPVYIGEEPYRIRVFDSYGQLVEDIDYLPGAVDAGGSTPPTPDTVIKTGDYILAFTNGAARSGCVRANGGHIGKEGAAGTGYDIERINDDTMALYKYLWGQDSGNTLVIVGGKGASADNDWELLKLMTLPDLCGRSLRGIDGMGGPVKNRLSSLTFASGNEDTVGSAGGSATHILTTAEMPSHSHTCASNDTGVSFRSHPYGADFGGAFLALSTAATDPSGAPGFNRLVDPEHDHPILNTGGGTAHSSTGPFSLCTVYIKL